MIPVLPQIFEGMVMVYGEELTRLYFYPAKEEYLKPLEYKAAEADAPRAHSSTNAFYDEVMKGKDND